VHLQGHPALEAAELINQRGVQVLVNLNGWAGEDRLDVLSYRYNILKLGLSTGTFTGKYTRALTF
jgi:predicted O-linked N-acetylglucosamine transferase (SPINDLY family)